MKQQVLALLFAITFSSASAQTHFTFQQCVDYAVKHHPSMQVYENDVQIASAKSTQASAAYLPQVSGSATLLNNLSLQKSILPAGLLGPEPTEIQFGTQYNTNAIIDVSQVIYDQSKIAGIRANKPYTEMTRLQQEQHTEMLIYNTASAYFQVLIYREQLRILHANKATYEEMVKVLQYRLQRGTVLEKDVDRVRVNLNTTNYQLEEASRKEQLSTNALKNAMGMPLERSLVVTDSVNYELFAVGHTDDSVNVSMLTAARINAQSVELQRLNLRVKLAGNLPTLSAIGRFGRQSLNDNFSEAFSQWTTFSYVGLSLNVPLFSGFKRSSMIKEEKLKLINEELNFTINKRNLQLEFDNARTSVTSSYSSFQSNRDNLDLARRLLEVTDYQYQRGVASLTDYLNDDAAYKAAQGNYINSLYNLMISQLNYQQARGNLLPFLSTLN